MPSHALSFGQPASNGDRMWALLTHLSTFYAPFLGPLVAWAILGSRAFVRYHAVQALALQVLLTVVGLLIGVVSFLTCGVGALLYVALVPFGLLPFVGAFFAGTGQWVGFPGLAGYGR